MADVNWSAGSREGRMSDAEVAGAVGNDKIFIRGNRV